MKGAPKASVKSKYEEDVFVNNHDCVWGSFFCVRSFRWGYRDDHSAVRNSYSTGAAGREANDAAAAGLVDVRQQRAMLEAKPADQRAAPLAIKADLYGDDAATGAALDEDKLREAMKRQAAADKAPAGDDDDRKRTYNSMKSTDVTVEDIEAYRRTRQKADDPMANISSDTLLDE